MLNSISRACIQQAVHAWSLYVTTTISVGGADHLSCEVTSLGTQSLSIEKKTVKKSEPIGPSRIHF